MPIITSAYKATDFLFAGDLQTILPALFRKVGNVFYTRERIVTPDNDFLDLDWAKCGNKKLAILNHGLEGNTQTQYILGMVKALHTHGWDVLAWNYRGCSGEINLQHRFYHSGETSDLDFIIQRETARLNYENIILVGFSVGGNITLKYLGEKGIHLNPKISKAVVFSVPCHLASSAAQLAKFRTKVYMRRFLKSLRGKFESKSKLYPDLIQLEGLYNIKNFYEFDEKYTAPLHGFKNAEEYWDQNSSIHFLKNITIPTLIVNARNDPFLSSECFPVLQAKNSGSVFLEMPKAGGHCGFYQKNRNGMYWSEKRTLEFIS